MRLITCPAGPTKGRLGHPCGKAADALREAGHTFEHSTVPGYKMLPWTRRGDARAEIRELTGQDDAPVLVLDDGTAIAGHKQIADWARSHPAP